MAAWTIGVLLSVFAGLALVLALVGVFAVLAQSVAQRRREIGVRMALGAAPRDIQRLVLSRASAIAAIGITVGSAAARFASRLLTTLSYEVEPTDPSVLSGDRAAALGRDDRRELHPGAPCSAGRSARDHPHRVVTD